MNNCMPKTPSLLFLVVFDSHKFILGQVNKLAASTYMFMSHTDLGSNLAKERIGNNTLFLHWTKSLPHKRNIIVLRVISHSWSQSLLHTHTHTRAPNLKSICLHITKLMSKQTAGVILGELIQHLEGELALLRDLINEKNEKKKRKKLKVVTLSGLKSALNH